MIGLDTNVIVRYLVQDEPAQSKKANHVIEHAVKNHEMLWICLITLCEMIWVLEKRYEVSKEELIHILQELLQTPQIRIEQTNIVELALRDYEGNSGVGFTDCLIGRQNIDKGCSLTYSFDKAATKKLPLIYKSL